MRYLTSWPWYVDPGQCLSMAGHGYDCSIIFPRETYATGNYTSIAVTLLMNKYRIRFASCSNSTSKFSLFNVYKTRHQQIGIEYLTRVDGSINYRKPPKPEKNV